jgi:hypothetical protein
LATRELQRFAAIRLCRVLGTLSRLVQLPRMDALKTHRHKLNKLVRIFLGRQLRLYYGILAIDTPPRFGEMLRDTDDQSPKVGPLNTRR